MLKQWIEVEGHVFELVNVEMHRKLFCFYFFFGFLKFLFLQMNHVFILYSSNEYFQSFSRTPELIKCPFS